MFIVLCKIVFSFPGLDSKAICEPGGTTNQRVMKGQDLNLNLCTESAVIGLKKMDSIHCFTLEGGFSR